MSEEHLIRTTVNGEERELLVSPRETLAEVLRERLRLTGTHVSCQSGICGVCTVVVDGDAVRACLTLAVQADGCEVRTVESLGSVDEPSELQRAFIEERALQCGFCTPGFLMLASWFLRVRPRATDEELLEAMSSNLCRCTGYRGIVNAVRKVRDTAAARAQTQEESS
ncbi:(2Fe-2S)-binding protein [Streptosporangium sp. NPDC051022]|uniref:(2Fe-2S)-binding protein n=1 Tax=Streptosporangium sp. NPDC051022 TaxID=3155752 RepID=UPI003414EAE1